MIIDKFCQIMVGNEMYSRRKVLAGIVMTTGPDLNQAQVREPTYNFRLK